MADQNSSTKKPGKEKGKKVLIGMTGGVDSTIAAFLLKKQGYNVTAVSLVMFDLEEEKNNFDLINGCRVDDLEKVKNICEELDIAYFGVNCQELYQELVIDPLVSARISGDEISPCSVCNFVKFETLLQKAEAMGADYIASGHYAKVQYNKAQNLYQLHSSNDEKSDQTSLLGRLEQRHLKKLILPLGDMRREEVEKLREKFRFEVLDKPNRDKQCFFDKSGLVEFIESKTDEFFSEEGGLVNFHTDAHMGDHHGLHHHKLGDKGVTPVLPTSIIDKNLKVSKIDFNSKNIWLGDGENLKYDKCLLKDFDGISEFDFSIPKIAFAKFPYQENKIKVKLFFKSNNQVILEWKEQITGLIRGQDIILFNKDTKGAKIIGRGVIRYLGEFRRLHRAAEVMDRETDENGDEIFIVGKEFEL